MKISAVCGLVIASGLASQALASNVLVNPGFEAGLSGWTPFGNVFADGSTPLSGTGVAKMFGGFSGGFNVQGMFQTFPAAPGENWSFSANFRHNTGDNLVGTGPGNFNWALAKFEFRNAADQVTGFSESAPFDGRNARDVWTPVSAGSLVAPAGTASVWAFFLFLQPAFDPGAVLIDDASLVPAPSAAGLIAVGGLFAARRRTR
jgi:MYXO-CTERM domain-containing protein